MVSVKMISMRWNDRLSFNGQELLGHQNVQTTMIYTHVLQKGGMGVKSPLDMLG